MQVKEAFNSEQSVFVYSHKEGLTKVESTIFEFLPKNMRILDVWCGGGRTTGSLYELGFCDILGLDFAEKLILSAQKKYPHIADKFVVWDVSDLSRFSDGEFDCIFFSFNGIDCLRSRDLRLRAYSEIGRVLRTGGLFIFSSHNRYCLPTNRNQLKTQVRNLLKIRREYWNTWQSFWTLPLYYSSEGALKRDLVKYWFNLLHVFPTVPLLYPLLDPFPYYCFKKHS